MTKRTKEKITVADPGGEAWHAEASRRWASAVDLATVLGEEPIALYDPLPLPDWREKAPAHVKRELFGRFLIDRATNVVHDVYAATPACRIDEIPSATFVHFWTEVLATPEDETPCGECMGA